MTSGPGRSSQKRPAVVFQGRIILSWVSCDLTSVSSAFKCIFQPPRRMKTFQEYFTEQLRFQLGVVVMLEQ